MYYRKLSYIIMVAMTILLFGWAAQSQAQDFEVSAPKNTLLGSWTLSTDEKSIITTPSGSSFDDTSAFSGSRLDITGPADGSSKLLEGSLIYTSGPFAGITIPVVGVIGRANQITLSLGDVSGFTTIEGLLVDSRHITATFVQVSSTGVGVGHFKAVRKK